MSLLDFTTFREITEKHIKDNFNLCPIQFENVPLLEKDRNEYISVFDKTSFSESTGMGESSNVTKGAIIIQIYTKKNIGTARARTIAKTLSDLLSEKNIGDVVVFGVAELHQAPLQDVYFQRNLIIPYTAIMEQIIIN